MDIRKQILREVILISLVIMTGAILANVTYQYHEFNINSTAIIATGLLIVVLGNLSGKLTSMILSFVVGFSFGSVMITTEFPPLFLLTALIFMISLLSLANKNSFIIKLVDKYSLFGDPSRNLIIGYSFGTVALIVDYSDKYVVLTIILTSISLIYLSILFTILFFSAKIQLFEVKAYPPYFIVYQIYYFALVIVILLNTLTSAVRTLVHI